MDVPQVLEYISGRLEYLKTSRPTAVNLADAAGKLWNAVLAESKKPHPTAKSILSLYLAQAEAMLADDIADNRAIGRFGANFILDGSAAALARGEEKQEQTGVSVLTHCNTGSLATAGWVSV
jgi:methylthioribose-1-phosphate isomerase